jgi:hypothetical protein
MIHRVSGALDTRFRVNLLAWTRWVAAAVERKRRGVEREPMTRRAVKSCVKIAVASALERAAGNPS